MAGDKAAVYRNKAMQMGKKRAVKCYILCGENRLSMEAAAARFSAISNGIQLLSTYTEKWVMG